MSETRETFDNFFGGAAYDMIGRLSGYGQEYYRKAAEALPVRPGMTLLDLGCGTASLSLALASRMKGEGRIVGIDLAKRQLERARSKVGGSPVPIELRHGSVRELPFESDSIDGICMSQVLHGLPEDVLTACLAESARILRQGGFFGLVEWSRPRFGYTALVWGATLLAARDTHNWRGTYQELFGTFGFDLLTDVRLDSLNRCQVFVKQR